MQKECSATDEAYKFLQAVPNPDGSLTRSDFFPSVPPTPEIIADSPSEKQVALSKDILLDNSNILFLRLLRPTKHADDKLPVIIDFHGGGFVICSAASAPFQNMWTTASALAPALVISVEYRLAPEHRLPAAYDDAMEAIMWVRDQAKDVEGCDLWMKELADYSNVYIMGTSAGEDRLSHNPALPLHASDLMWLLSLPHGCDRDHEYSNPLIGCNPKIERLPRCLIRGFEGDPLVDRIKGLVKMLKATGVQVVPKIEDGGFHGSDILDESKVQELCLQIKDFIYSS
ncbi:hypothetical protein AgCh_016609 [Apium graveolens]